MRQAGIQLLPRVYDFSGCESAINLTDFPCLSRTLPSQGEIAMLRKFLRDQSGATEIEYCLLAVFLSITIVAGARAIGTNLNANMYGPIASNLN
jgi:pilus assembly protein Flp/PilA